MPTTDAHQHVVPEPTGEAPARAAFDRLSASIRDIKYVADTTARAALVVALTSAGAAPSSSNPLFVWRGDATAGHELEVTTDGITWGPPYPASSAWEAISLDSGRVVDGSHPAPAYRLEDDGDVLRLRTTRLTVTPGLAVTAGTTYGIASGGNALPAAARPAAGWRYAGGRGYLSAAPSVPSPIRITVSSTGEIEFRPTASGTMSAIEWGDSLMYLPAS